MARLKIVLTAGEVKTPAALPANADWKCTQGVVRYLPAYPSDAPNVWPEGYEGIELKNETLASTLADEQLHVIARGNAGAVIEVYSQGV